MASNFGIAIDKKNDGFGLQLEGDFDATSAYELIHAIKKLPEDTGKICIHTNGLKNIYPFGLNVFFTLLSSLNGQSTKIVFKGHNASRLSLGHAWRTS
jgi:anti-anti-sigma regulatory factor